MGWLRNLGIVLTQKKVSYILYASDPNLIGNDAIEEQRTTYKIWHDNSMIVKYILIDLIMQLG